MTLDNATINEVRDLLESINRRSDAARHALIFDLSNKVLAKLDAAAHEEKEAEAVPFGYFCDWGNDSYGLQRIAMYYGEPGSGTADDWNEFPKVYENIPLYTRPPAPPELAEAAKKLERAMIRVLDKIPLTDSDYFNTPTATEAREALAALSAALKEQWVES